MLEKLPPYLTFNNDVKVESRELVTTGDLQSGDFTIDELKAGELATITYSVTLNELPKDVDNVVNIATDNGGKIKAIDTCDSQTDDCDSTVTSIKPQELRLLQLK